MTLDSEHSRRRRLKALRAARAVTLGLGMALAGSACSTSHEGGDAAVPDGAADGSPDAVADARPDADASDCEGFPNTRACCESWGGFWDDASGSCGVPGPFVPPSMA